MKSADTLKRLENYLIKEFKFVYLLSARSAKQQTLTFLVFRRIKFSIALILNAFSCLSAAVKHLLLKFSVYSLFHCALNLLSSSPDNLFISLFFFQLSSFSFRASSLSESRLIIFFWIGRTTTLIFIVSSPCYDSEDIWISFSQMTISSRTSPSPPSISNTFLLMLRDRRYCEEISYLQMMVQSSTSF